MNNIKVIFIMTASTCVLASSASAIIEIATSYVGNPDNATDSSTGGLYGAVSYGYYIGTYEVTNSQYVSFLNAKAQTDDTYGLYNPKMTTGSYSDNRVGGINRDGTGGSYIYSSEIGFENKPVNYVSFFDAARFTNWLTNGQGSGDTETGVYTLNGISGNVITRNTGAGSAWANGGVAITSEDEWYKAAYYDPTRYTAGGYWDVANQSNAITKANANYASNTLTDVGNYSGDDSYYGTFDQAGNVAEWNDEPYAQYLGLRGGAFYSGGSQMQSSWNSANPPISEYYDTGFRVSSLAPIPEPSAFAAIFGCLSLMLTTIRRSR